MPDNNDFDTSIISVANDFYEAYLRCIHGKNPTVDKHNRVCYQVVNVPAIVNGAFAIELYTKSMSNVGNSKLKKLKHNIRDLLSILEQSTQFEIKKEVESKLDKHQTYDECLNVINDAFVFWRYIHTKKDFGFGLNKTLEVLSLFLNAIREIAMRHNLQS